MDARWDRQIDLCNLGGYSKHIAIEEQHFTLKHMITCADARFKTPDEIGSNHLLVNCVGTRLAIFKPFLDGYMGITLTGMVDIALSQFRDTRWDGWTAIFIIIIIYIYIAKCMILTPKRRIENCLYTAKYDRPIIA